jgi:hypothetical protein
VDLPKPRHLLTAAFAREERESKARFKDRSLKQDYEGRRFRRYCQNDGANYETDYVDVPDEYGAEYSTGLEESGYVAAEEFTFPELPEKLKVCLLWCLAD